MILPEPEYLVLIRPTLPVRVTLTLTRFLDSAIAMLLKEQEGIQGASQLVKAFFKSSVVIGILLGIALNVAGARQILYDFPVTAAIMAMLQYLANLTIPLILIIIGYGIKFDRYCLRETSTVILARLAILIPLVLVVNIVLIQGLLQLEKPFEIALFTLFILRPLSSRSTSGRT